MKKVMGLLAAFMLFGSVGAFAGTGNKNENKPKQENSKIVEVECKTVTANISCRESPIEITICCNGCSNVQMFIIACILYDITEIVQCSIWNSF